MINILFLISAFLFMEFVAWFTHKYVMHGFLWVWHSDHHKNDNKRYKEIKTSRFEKNDLFFLVYAIPAMVLIISEFYFSVSYLIFMGFGITLYGLTYFLIHDVLIHQRIKIPKFILENNKYFKELVNAHLSHHKSRSREDFQSFGLLIFPKLFKKP